MERKTYDLLTLLFFALLSLAVLNLACLGDPAAGGEADGDMLLTEYCSGCHLQPDPKALPRAVWAETVLPRMAELVEVPTRDWSALRAYVLAQAPDKLPESAFVVGPERSDYLPRFPGLYLSPPSTGYLQVAQGGVTYLADINKERLFALDTTLADGRSWMVGHGLTDLTRHGTAVLATVIGSFTPTDEANGRLLRLLPDGGVRELASGLRRPTSLCVMDLDADGKQETYVTEFGKTKGGFTRFTEGGGGNLLRQSITERPGAIRVRSETDTSLLVLYGQGDEGIWRYTAGRGRITGRMVLRFPPNHGSSGFRLVDWNGDGHQDILYTNGDNADYLPVEKPYHGITLFVNDGLGGYEEGFFLPFPGAYDAIPLSGADGAREIAAVSFFPAFTTEREASIGVFTLPASGGDPYFSPLPGAGNNRFMCLSVGDVNQDGRPDILAGCMSMAPHPDDGRMQDWLTAGLPFVAWLSRE